MPRILVKYRSVKVWFWASEKAGGDVVLDYEPEKQMIFLFVPILAVLARCTHGRDCLVSTTGGVMAIGAMVER